MYAESELKSKLGVGGGGEGGGISRSSKLSGQLKKLTA